MTPAGSDLSEYYQML